MEIPTLVLCKARIGGATRRQPDSASQMSMDFDSDEPSGLPPRREGPHELPFHEFSRNYVFSRNDGGEGGTVQGTGKYRNHSIAVNATSPLRGLQEAHQRVIDHAHNQGWLVPAHPPSGVGQATGNPGKRHIGPEDRRKIKRGKMQEVAMDRLTGEDKAARRRAAVSGE